jgi:hypothetical protein
MSQLILDDQLDVHVVLEPLRRWIGAERLAGLRPHQRILDERVPAILRTLHQPTFVTIDHQFSNARWCHPNYCILYIALRDVEQQLLPGLLRALLRHPEFRTRARRMGKVARITTTAIECWAFRVRGLQRIEWEGVPRRKQ